MDTLIQSNAETSSKKAEKIQTRTGVSDIIAQLEANRFGLIPLLLVIITVLGAVAAAYAVQESELKLMAVAVSTTFVEILIIALAPVRMILIASAIALIVDLCVFIF